MLGFMLITIIIYILTLIWAFTIIVPQQIKFDDTCKNTCSDKGLNYYTEFQSYPINNLNGKCFCFKKELINIQ